MLLDFFVFGVWFLTYIMVINWYNIESHINVFTGGFWLNEQKTGLTITGAIVLLSLAILFGSFQISSAIRDASSGNQYSGIYNQLSSINSNLETLIETLKENK
jgi:hypothetical protein